jgi:transposase
MLGLDVAKDTLTVCAWEPDQAEPTWERPYPNSAAGLRRLLTDSSPRWPWVLEPTGPYSELAVRLGQEAGRTVLQAPPRAAKQYLRSLNPRAKTDPVDARGLCRFAQDRTLRPWRRLEPSLQRLGQLLRVRRTLTKALASLRQQCQVLTAAAAELQQALAALQAQVKGLDQAIAQAGRQQELFLRLRALPGVGPITAAALTVCLASIDFASKDAFVAYVGLDLRVHDSGKHKGRRGLTKQGDAQLRWLLYLAARATLRQKDDPGFQAYYQRKLAEGCTTTGAICILARKLAKAASGRSPARG